MYAYMCTNKAFILFFKVFFYLLENVWISYKSKKREKKRKREQNKETTNK